MLILYMYSLKLYLLMSYNLIKLILYPGAQN